MGLLGVQWACLPWSHPPRLCVPGPIPPLLQLPGPPPWCSRPDGRRHSPSTILMLITAPLACPHPHPTTAAAAVPSALVLSPDHRKHFLSTLVMLITGQSVRAGQTDPAIMFTVLNMLRAWLLEPRTGAPVLTAKELLVIMQRVAQVGLKLVGLFYIESVGGGCIPVSWPHCSGLRRRAAVAARFRLAACLVCCLPGWCAAMTPTRTRPLPCRRHAAAGGPPAGHPCAAEAPLGHSLPGPPPPGHRQCQPGGCRGWAGVGHGVGFHPW